MMSVMGIPPSASNLNGSHIILTTEDDNRLCRIANGDYGDDDDNENETAPPTAEDEGEVSLPMRPLGVSLSGCRTTRFILRLTFSVTCAPGSTCIAIGLS